MEAQQKEVNHLASQTRSLLSRKAVRNFIKQNGRHVTQVEASFYIPLEQRIKNAILKAIANNASRKRLTQYALYGDKGSKEMK
jgi:hypothetical protein